MNSKQWKMDSPIGPLYLVASPEALQGVYWKKQNVPMEETDVHQRAARELNEYFAGRRKRFTVKLDAQGTEFQREVWEQLRLIPYGETCSYRDIATRVKRPRAVRAVGTANGRNPLCIIVPCHRVIAANGTLAGYAGGLKIKTRLLELEKAQASKRSSE